MFAATAEAAGSSPVVPAILLNGLQRTPKNDLGPFGSNKLLHPLPISIFLPSRQPEGARSSRTSGLGLICLPTEHPQARLHPRAFPALNICSWRLPEDTCWSSAGRYDADSRGS